MSLLAFCHWVAKTHIGIAMRDSSWDFAVVEIFHLLALAIFGGAVLLVDLRLLDLAFKDLPRRQIAREFLPFTVGGVVAMVVSGYLMFANGPVRYYFNPAFRLKIALFLLATVVHFALQIWTAYRSSEKSVSTLWSRGASVASLLLWFAIGLAGRAIGYV
jgi:hypothetical protein